MGDTQVVVPKPYGTTRHKPQYFEKVILHLREVTASTKSLCLGSRSDILALLPHADMTTYGNPAAAQALQRFLEDEAVVLRDGATETFYFDQKRAKVVSHCINRSTEAGVVTPEARKGIVARLKQYGVPGPAPVRQPTVTQEVSSMVVSDASQVSSSCHYRLFMLADEHAVWEQFRPVDGKPAHVAPQEDAVKRQVIEELVAAGVVQTNDDSTFRLQKPFSAYHVTVIEERKELTVAIEYLKVIREMQRADWRPEPGMGSQPSFEKWMRMHPELSKLTVNPVTLISKLWSGPNKDGRQNWGIVTTVDGQNDVLVAVQGFEYWDFKEGAPYKARPRGNRVPNATAQETTSELSEPADGPRIEALLELMESVKLEPFSSPELDRLEQACQKLTERTQLRKKEVQAEVRARLEREVMDRRANMEKLMKAASEEETRLRELEEQLKSG